MSKPIDLAACSEEELWRFVAAHLESRGIGVVLVGGAVVAVYSQGAYRSGDLDFVLKGLFPPSVEGVMAEIGFQPSQSYFVHPECSHLFVQFVPGPLGIGERTDIEPLAVPEGDVLLEILSPTDCVCDRLASAIHFQARECLDQAALVARAQRVDWKRIEAWCRGEGSRGLEAFWELKRLVEGT